MKTLSLKLEDQIFNEAEGVISKIRKTRNRYINEAVDYYNKYNKRKILAAKLSKESKLVQEESMAVLAEFDRNKPLKVKQFKVWTADLNP